MYQDFAAVSSNCRFITAQSSKNDGYWVFSHKWDTYIIPSQAMEQLRQWEDLTARGVGVRQEDDTNVCTLELRATGITM